MAGLLQRGSTWHLRMRVPTKYRSVEKRSEIHLSLKTDSERRARELLPAVEAQIISDLDALIELQPGARDRSASLAAANRIATSRGFSYRPVTALAEGPIEEILDRFAAMPATDGPEVARALLGGIEEPGLRLSELADEVERIKAHDNRFKNPNQMRLWRNPKKRAVDNLRKALGGADPMVSEIDNAEALKHRTWWRKKISAENLSPETANRDFANMAGMLKAYYESISQPSPPEPYRRVSLKERHRKSSRKLEIPSTWIVDKWFAEGAFDGINAEARDILLISIETGCRQSEICDLPPGAIVLDHPIPHIRIEFGDGEFRREVKNLASARLVPLVGVALAAARRHPDGFPRYRGTSSYSANMNDRLRTRSLFPTPEHTVGGTRHAWESRMKRAGISSDDRGAMMGHSIRSIREREVYGDDMPLEMKRWLADRVMFDVPSHLL